MATLQPRGPYSPEELRKLYPEGLQLYLVQILMRHGERSPVSPRFENAGLTPFWPYCSVARKMYSATKDPESKDWTPMQWTRRLETFGSDDGPVPAAGPRGEIDSVCSLGELTDKGRQTTTELGRRLRMLYIDQLGYMPSTLQDADSIYLRATPIPRALESLQQAFMGMYSTSQLAKGFPPPTIIQRAIAEETLFPNDSNCRRFAQLSRAFAQRTSDRWNTSDDMEYLNKLIGKWMPETSKRVAIDSHPRLSGIMDTVNSTFSHGPETRLPKEFYDAKGRAIIDRLGVEEWFSGYQESREYRMLGIGGLMGDIVSRMVQKAENKSMLKLALSGCHDTTLAAVLTSLGAFQGEHWPPYTSHIALETFRLTNTERLAPSSNPAPAAIEKSPSVRKGWLETFGLSSIFGGTSKSAKPQGIARRKIEELSEAKKSKLEGYYVRVRYNDKVMTVPGCKAPGRHLEGDETFCTLEAFKSIVDKYTPASHKTACWSNLDKETFPATPEPAGF